MKKIILIAILVSGCFGYPTEWDIELWEQKIENSNLSVYKFDAWGGRDSNVSGLKIIESSKGFTQEDVLKKDEFSFFKSIPNKNSLEVIRTIRKTDESSNEPIEKKSYWIKGIAVNQETYEYNGTVTGICALKSYQFKSFEETRNSLIFYENKSQFVNGESYDRILIPKGNVYLITSKDKRFLERVVYSDLMVFEDEVNNNRVKSCRITKYFYPIDKIKIGDFSDYGIYKPIK